MHIACGIITLYYHFFRYLSQQDKLDQLFSSIDYIYTSFIVCIHRILLFQFPTFHLTKESQLIQQYLLKLKSESCVQDLLLLLLQVSKL